MSDLTEAAESGLDEFKPQSEAEQLAAVPACQVRFKGVGYDMLDDTPDLKEEMEFTIKGFISERGVRVLANGEQQDVATLKVTKVEPVEA